MQPDTQTFLDLLGGRHTIQTFDDNPDRKDAGLARILHKIDENELAALNKRGAGIFMMINEGDGRGRSASNVERLRAAYADLDGAPIPLFMPLYPSLIIESSPNRYHLYWLIEGDAPLDEFTQQQAAIAEWFGSDPTVKDLPRVMRLPGFDHMKGDPTPVRIIGGNKERYTWEQIKAAYPQPEAAGLRALPPVRPAVAASSNGLPSPDKILEVFMRSADLAAGRNEVGFQLALQVRDNGHPQFEAERILREYQSLVETNGQHPYTLDEALHSARQAYTRAAREPWTRKPDPTYMEPLGGRVTIREGVDLTTQQLTELGNAHRFVTAHGPDLRHNDLGWISWTGQRWKTDGTKEAEFRASSMIEQLLQDAARMTDHDKRSSVLKWALSSQRASVIRNTIGLASSFPELQQPIAEFDTHAELLNTPTGTLDLDSGVLRPHSRADALTQITSTPFDTAAACPTWVAFQLEVAGGNAELVRFKQKAFGYTISGGTHEQILFIAYGSGANGKSTELDAIRFILGDYAKHADFASFAQKRNDNPKRNDLARLRGARMVTAVESNAGVRLDEGLVKSTTGGEPITAAFHYREFFEFYPQFKLWLATNHKPIITGSDLGIWRRIRLVPYLVTFPPEQQDKYLAQKLRAEAPGILAWLAEGYRLYKAEGLEMPAAVMEATTGYRNEMDVVQQFIDDCLVLGPAESTPNTDLRKAYQWWCAEEGHYAMSARSLTQALQEKGFKQQRGNYRYWPSVGISTDIRQQVLYGSGYTPPMKVN